MGSVLKSPTQFRQQFQRIQVRFPGLALCTKSANCCTLGLPLLGNPYQITSLIRSQRSWRLFTRNLDRMKAGNVLYRVVNARYRAYRPQTLKTSKCNFKYDDAHHDAHATGTGAGAGTGTGRLSKKRIKQQRKFVHPQPNELSLDRCRTRERTLSALKR